MTMLPLYKDFICIDRESDSTYRFRFMTTSCTKRLRDIREKNKWSAGLVWVLLNVIAYYDGIAPMYANFLGQI